jgi:hypothetical protein
MNEKSKRKSIKEKLNNVYEIADSLDFNPYIDKPVSAV